jgi:hypothetical protein
MSSLAQLPYTTHDVNELIYIRHLLQDMLNAELDQLAVYGKRLMTVHVILKRSLYGHRFQQSYFISTRTSTSTDSRHTRAT